MRNYIQKGDSLTVPMPAAVVGGEVVIIGALIGVAAGSYAMGEEGVICTEGVFELAKDASVFTVGAPVYYDAVAKLVTTTTTDNTLIGAATTAALTGDATVRVFLG